MNGEVGIVKAESYCWTSTRTLAVFAAAAALLGAFVAIERRAVAPLVPFDIFRLRTVSGANLTMLFAGAATFGLFYFLSLSMQQVLGYSALETGLAQLPLAVTLILAAGIVSPLVTRLGQQAGHARRHGPLRRRTRLVLAHARRRRLRARPARPVASWRSASPPPSSRSR